MSQRSALWACGSCEIIGANRQRVQWEIVLCRAGKESVIIGLSGKRENPHFGRKYEQTVNKPKITLKKPFSEYSENTCKTGSQTLYLCGFPEASVEMRVAPFRALTHSTAAYRCSLTSHCRNEGRPFQGIDTLIMYQSQSHRSSR